MEDISLILSCSFFFIAILYSMVGHAGASGYLAAMGLVGVAPIIMKPTALTLNLVVSFIAFWQFYTSGHFSLKKLIPFVMGSVPLAMLGGYLTLPDILYKQILGGILLLSAIGLIYPRRPMVGRLLTLPMPTACLAGASIGFLAGLTGTGGGIFLSPLLLHMRWASIRETSGLAAGFIFLNSLSGIIGHGYAINSLPHTIIPYIGFVIIGGLIGSMLGCRYVDVKTIKTALVAVLFIAGLKLLFLR